ncbi:MAG: enoyl-CoA hydratase/isomerase family protein [Alphaproteobacteria bacterium]
MSESNHLVAIEGGVARVTLNRPAVHNALDDKLIADLRATLEGLAADAAVRLVTLTGQGASFCAGGDLAWMRRTADYTFEQNLADAMMLARLLHTLNTMPQPTVALVNGPAYGGGVGLVACCDIAVAADTAKFSLSEVRLGLIPATISPYVVRKIGESSARRYFLTAEVFEAADAERMGLVHEVVAAAGMDEAAAWFAKRLREGGPRSQAAAKQLIARVAGAPIDEGLMADTAERIASQRASAEGKEGTEAFLAKRPPAWRS